MVDTTMQISLCFKALADDSRIKIFNMIKSKERCACELLKHLACTQPTLSYHMKIMTDSGLVVSRKSGKSTYYHLSSRARREMLMYLTNEIGDSYYDE